MQNLNNQTKEAELYLEKAGRLTEQALDRYIPKESETPSNLHAAMRYALFAGGKRLRPALAQSAYEIFGGVSNEAANAPLNSAVNTANCGSSNSASGENIFLAMCALEMLHTFSLIHDDLPCMDNDDFRRGKPTTHKVYGEAVAVLAGDALCIFAFELIARTGNAAVVEELARSLGTRGMIGGQVTDIESEGKQVDLATVDYIHYHKTAALIEASLVIGALLAGAKNEELKIIRKFGMGIGLVFQIVDDILDIESSTEELGKDVGSDIKNGKATYPAILGLQLSKRKAKELYEESLAELEKLQGRDITNLKNIAALIIARKN